MNRVTDETFAEVVLGSRKPVLVDFTARWCPPCRMIEPVLDQVAAERDDVTVVSLDIDENPRTQAVYGVLAAPTLMVFRGGEPVRKLVGARPKTRLLRELDECLGEDVQALIQ